MNYMIEYDGILSEQFQVYPVKRPDIPCPVYDLEEVKIPGRDGALHIDNRRYEPITITINFNYIGPEEMWAAKWRAIKKWLSTRNTTLKFTDDSDCFYRVYNVVLDKNERVTRRIGKFTASFTCDPYVYLEYGATSTDVDEAVLCLVTANKEDLLEASGATLLISYWGANIVNPYDVCHPLYEISGKGECKMFVNSSEITLNIDKHLTIDTDLQAAYKADGSKASHMISGRYADMWLRPGENAITVQDGFKVSIKPNWREI